MTSTLDAFCIVALRIDPGNWSAFTVETAEVPQTRTYIELRIGSNTRYSARRKMSKLNNINHHGFKEHLPKLYIHGKYNRVMFKIFSKI